MSHLALPESLQMVQPRRWPRRRVYQGIAWIVLVNLAVRFGWLLYMHPPQVDDFAWYFSHATQMYKGQGYVWYGHPTAYWPIGYPFFLSLLFHLTGPSVTAGLCVNILLSTGIVLLVYGLTVRIFDNDTFGFAAAAGYTLLPSQIEWNSVLGSEELFTFLLALSLWIYIQDPVKLWSKMYIWRIIVSGLVMGLAADVRPIVLLLPFALILFERFALGRSVRDALGAAAIFGVALCAGVAPVTIRNVVALHHFVVVSTNGGVNLWQGTHSNGWYFWSWNPKVNPLLPYLKNDVLENQVAMHAALMFYKAHPLLTLWNGFEKWFFLYSTDWNVVSVTFAEQTPHVSQSVIHFNMWFNNIVYYVWMMISVTGLVQTFRRVRKPFAFLLVTYIAYNTAIFFFFPAWDRFRYPMMPLYAVFFGVGAWYIVRRGIGGRPLDRCTLAGGYRSSMDR
ncbi:ArnT family glycosyltransferase [Alicyclobacillus mengziensis]|uniref:ArnT family glycosyltransferase n=1 Tax=Alicyclobacillus mengziensis TaxID=2931921 RepID=UPI0020115D93|nr:glycosyltransferase family 39 protein [Alicyclobacillus mengziensis]